MQTVPPGADLLLAAGAPALPSDGAEPLSTPAADAEVATAPLSPARVSWRVVALAVAIAAALGAAQGMRAVVGGHGEVDAPQPGSITRDWRRGSLWLPAGSEARRPEAPARPMVWHPEEGGGPGVLGD